MKYRVPLVLWGIAAWQLVMAVVAALAKWPAQFGTDGSSPASCNGW
jgi:tellurite resistance protein TehA-like permease